MAVAGPWHWEGNQAPFAWFFFDGVKHGGKTVRIAISRVNLVKDWVDLLPNYRIVDPVDRW